MWRWFDNGDMGLIFICVFVAVYKRVKFRLMVRNKSRNHTRMSGSQTWLQK
jgi:hypothetical protein